MKWNCYINRRVPTGVETTKEVLDLPNTTKADMRFACMEASKKFRVSDDAVLCIPTCTHDCTETTHSHDCQERCEPTAPILTDK